ncbi:hypothetical protein [Phocaeicola sp.]
MNKEEKDKGIRKAMKEQPQFRLPSNFVYRTMQKVEETALLRERQTERRTLWATILASIFLVTGSIACAFIFFGNAIKQSFSQSITQVESPITHFPTPYLLFIATITLLLLFDRWMRKQYFKRNV